MRNGTSLAGEVAGPSMDMETPAVNRPVTVSSELVQRQCFAQFFYQAGKKEKCLNSRVSENQFK